jgi:hypothetical protein
MARLTIKDAHTSLLHQSFAILLNLLGGSGKALLLGLLQLNIHLVVCIDLSIVLFLF